MPRLKKIVSYFPDLHFTTIASLHDRRAERKVFAIKRYKFTPPINPYSVLLCSLETKIYSGIFYFWNKLKENYIAIVLAGEFGTSWRRSGTRPRWGWTGRNARRSAIMRKRKYLQRALDWMWPSMRCFLMSFGTHVFVNHGVLYLCYVFSDWSFATFYKSPGDF